jgi:NADPH:quinone reductase-like Zn-dependent oxidoreductase
MKAIRLHARAGAKELVFEDAPMPVPLDGEVLVSVLASGITRNELDWGPTYTNEKGEDRLPTIPGHELCGIVEKIMPGVTDLAPGDTVYGLTSFFRNGAAAEYIAVRAADLAPKPISLTPIQAAAVPLSALTAWQALFVHGRLQVRQKIMIHGAAGGVGTFAVQMARWCGAQIIATAAPENLGLIKSLGADMAIDYRTFSYENHLNEFDIVFDPIGGDTQNRSWPLLKPGGVLVSIAGESIKVPETARGARAVFFIVRPDRFQLMEIGRLIDEKHIRPVISAVFPLVEAARAFDSLLEPNKQGKVVLKVV